MSAKVVGSLYGVDDDCPGDDSVCLLDSGFSTLRVCKRIVASDEQCGGANRKCTYGFEYKYHEFEDQHCLQ